MENSPPKDKDLIGLANSLLAQFRDGICIQCIEDIGSAFFVTLFEGLFSENLKTVIRRPVTREDEIYNVQLVIDSLAANIIHDPLPHIRGIDIIDGNRIAISNLLEIFQSLSEYLLQDIETDNTADSEDFRAARSHDVEAGRSLEIDSELVRRDLHWDDEPIAGHQIQSADQPKEAWPPANGIKESRSESDHPQMLRSNGSKFANTLTDLDKLSQEIDIQRRGLAIDYNRNADCGETSQLTMTDLSSSQQHRSPRFNHIGVRPVADFRTDAFMQSRRQLPPEERRVADGTCGRGLCSFTHHHYHHYPRSPLGVISSAASVPLVNGHSSAVTSSTAAPTTTTAHPTTIPSSAPNISGFSASLPLPSRRQENLRDTRFRATVGVPCPSPEHSWLKSTSDTRKTLTEHAQIHTLDKEKLRKEPTSPTAGKDHPSVHRQHSPLSRKQTDEDKAEKPFDYAKKLQGLSASYDNLQNLVSHTAALARQAVATSPVRLRAERETDLSASPLRPQLGRNTDIHSRSHTDKLSREDSMLASDLNIPPRTMKANTSANSAAASSFYSGGQAARKVSFFGDRSTSSGADRRSFQTSRDSSPLRINKKKTRPKSSHLAHVRYSSPTEPGYLSDHEMDIPEIDHARRWHKEVIEDVLSSDNEQNVYTSDVRSQRTKPRSSQGRSGGLAKKRTGKQVKFTDSTKKPVSTGVLAETRDFLNKENITQSRKTKFLKDIYHEDYGDFFDEAFEELGKTRKAAKETETQYKKKVLTTGKNKKQKNLKPKRKGQSLVVKKNRVLKPTVSTKARKHSSTSGGPPLRQGSITIDDEEDLVPMLLEEFPYLYLSESTWHELWRQGISQIERLTRVYEENKRKKSKAQEQMEEAEKRHKILTDVVKKDLEQTRRLREIKERQKQQIVLRNKIHEKRMQSARARKYYDEYQVRMRAKMLKRRTREELIFKNLVKEALEIQKDRIKEIRRYATEQRKTHAEKRQHEIDSLENYYRDQFEMLAEKVAQEKKNLEVRDSAQQKILDQMKKQLRKKMEKEIQNFQEQIFRDEDDAYFRQLDADRLKHELHMAKYQTKI